MRHFLPEILLLRLLPQPSRRQRVSFYLLAFWTTSFLVLFLTGAWWEMREWQRWLLLVPCLLALSADVIAERLLEYTPGSGMLIHEGYLYVWVLCAVNFGVGFFLVYLGGLLARHRSERASLKQRRLVAWQLLVLCSVAALLAWDTYIVCGAATDPWSTKYQWSPLTLWPGREIVSQLAWSLPAGGVEWAAYIAVLWLPSFVLAVLLCHILRRVLEVDASLAERCR